MLQTFFKVNPIAWVDLPPMPFDKYNERRVAEATIGSTLLSIRAVVYEVEREYATFFMARINGIAMGVEFATLDEAKRYVYDLLQAYIASLISPAVKADEADYTDITND
nr:MAG TPA: hypothetical protein [Caudoviricetes sp.]